MKKDIAEKESMLQKLEIQEKKHTAALDAALQEYKTLTEQAAELDPVELYRARAALRPDKEQNAAGRIQAAYGDRFDSGLMFSCKRDVSATLADDKAERIVKARLWQRQLAERRKEQAARQRKPKNIDWER